MRHVGLRSVCPGMLAPLAALALAACPAPTAEVTPRTTKDTAGASTSAVHAAPARDTASEQRAARLQLRLLERDAHLAELAARLGEAPQEVVRGMAKLQTVASRAEAAGDRDRWQRARRPGCHVQSALHPRAGSRAARLFLRGAMGTRRRRERAGRLDVLELARAARVG